MKPRLVAFFAVFITTVTLYILVSACSRRDKYGTKIGAETGSCTYGGCKYGDCTTTCEPPPDAWVDLCLVEPRPSWCYGGIDASVDADGSGGNIDASVSDADAGSIDASVVSDAGGGPIDAPRDASVLYDAMPDGQPPKDGPPPDAPPKNGLITLYAIPSTIPLDWSSPWNLGNAAIYSTTLGDRWKIFPKMHSIGHALTIVDCPGRREVISQTGEPSDLLRSISEAQFLAGALFRKYGGSLQDANDATKELAERKKYYYYYRYSTLAPPVAETVLSTTHPDPNKIDKKAPFDHIPTVVQLDMEIDKAQCDAVFEWFDAYKKAAAETNYGLHFAPWLLEGGGCGSVALTPAFWATGAEWKTAACGWSIPLKVGSARVAFGNVGINGFYPKGSLLQNGADAWPQDLGAVGKFKDLGVKWTSDTMKAWQGDNDYVFNAKFGKTFVPIRMIDPTLMVDDAKRAWQLKWNAGQPPAAGTKVYMLGVEWEIAKNPEPYKHIHFTRSIVGKTPRKVGVDKDPKICP